MILTNFRDFFWDIKVYSPKNCDGGNYDCPRVYTITIHHFIIYDNYKKIVYNINKLLFLK